MRNICTVDGCEQYVAGQGLCQKHYMRKKRTGSPTGWRKKQRGTCEFRGCREPAHGRGLCLKHWSHVYRSERKREPVLHHGRVCARCGDEIAPERSGKAIYCSARCKALAISNKPENVAKRKDYHRARKFGLTAEQYREMLARANHCCEICGEAAGDEFPLCVDHCHSTNAVRGVLCSRCNSGLGQFQDDPARLRAAADYIERCR